MDGQELVRGDSGQKRCGMGDTHLGSTSMSSVHNSTPPCSTLTSSASMGVASCSAGLLPLPPTFPSPPAAAGGVGAAPPDTADGNLVWKMVQMLSTNFEQGGRSTHSLSVTASSM